jgi:hypothetical protein
MNTIKNCENCGKSFIIKKDTAKYCSGGCRQEAYRKRNEMPVPHFLAKSTNLGSINENNSTQEYQESSSTNSTKEHQELRKIVNKDYISNYELIVKIKSEQEILDANKNSLLKLYNKLINDDIVKNSKIICTILGLSIGGLTVNSNDEFSNQLAKITIGGIIGFIAGTYIGEYNFTKAEKKRISEIKDVLSKIMKIDFDINNLKVKLIQAENNYKKIPQFKNIVEISQVSNMPVKTDIPVKADIPVKIENNRKMSNLKGIVNSKDLLNMNFQTWDFKDKWQEFIGNPSLNFNCLIYGSSGAGKSTFAIQMSEFLANNLGRVLYVSSEEGLSHTLKDKIKRTHGANSEYLDFVEYNNFIQLKEGIINSKYPFIFIDSINNLKIKPHELSQIIQENPNRSFISIFQATKDGDIKGSTEYMHDSDIIIKVANGQAETTKNRFKEKAKIPIFL